MSVVASLETEALKIAGKIKAGIEAAGNDAVKLASFVETNGPEITALASLAGTGATTATGVGLSLLNLVIKAVQDAGTAGSANGLTVSLDAAVVADVKAVIAAIEKV